MTAQQEPAAARSDQERSIVVYGAIAANLGVAVAKLGAAALTGSSAMISEGIHSLVDTGNQVMLLLGVKRSRRPADSTHPFGHGHELYFWSLIVAVALFGVGGGMSLYEGVTHVLHPSPLEDPLPNYVVLAIALVLEASSWTLAVRRQAREATDSGVLRSIRESKDPSVITVLMEDSAAIAGILIAAIGIVLAQRLSDPRVDGVASIIIGLLLCAVSLFLAAESRGLLIGERTDPELIDRMVRDAEGRDDIDHVEQVRTMHLGPRQVLVTMRVVTAAHAAADVADSLASLAADLRELDPRLSDITIQPVPGRPRTP